MVQTEYDVIVVGAGNAALSAALAALDAGARVLILEKSPKAERGGNSKFTAIYRFAFSDLEALRALCPEIDDKMADRMVINPYTKERFLDDIKKVSKNTFDERTMNIIVGESYDTMIWLKEHGLQFTLGLQGAKEVNGKLTWTGGIVVYPKGAGMQIVETLFAAVENAGADIRYDTPVTGLVTDEAGRVRGVKVRPVGESQASVIKARAVVLGAGGFEANPEMRARYLGPFWDLTKVRGSRYNTGECLQMAMNIGAATAGQWSGCHATMVHSYGKPYEMGDAAFPHQYHLSVLVNLDGERFLNESEDFPFYTYAKFGRAVLGERDGKAFQVFDAKAVQVGRTTGRSVWVGSQAMDLPHGEGDTLEEAARQVGIERVEQFLQTVATYNAAVQGGTIDLSHLDGRGTTGLKIEKTNWAMTIDTPPYKIIPVECGITFTFGGLRFNEHGQVLDFRDNPIGGLYVVGEMAGTFFVNYAAGSGLTKGAVFGRRAGSHAASNNHPA